MLALTFRAPLVNPAEPTFSDVGRERWSYAYVETCKDFLTGYNNPFGGKPSFHPTEYATREDIAVALVRMMGLTEKDTRNPNYARERFYDGDDISPHLLPYISIAVERGLIKGYPDGNFGPQNGITRAEAVVLLNRATKQALTSINDELELSANVVSSFEKPSLVTIYIETEEGATVTVDGEQVRMDSNIYGKYEGAYLYEFEEEGTKTFTVVAKKGGKTKTIAVTAKYEINAPVLNITECPTTTDSKSVTIRGNVKDKNDPRPVVTINGSSASVDYFNGDWSKTINLVEGANTITIIATNNLGKSTVVERTIIYKIGSPEIVFTNCPEVTEQKNITIQGYIGGNNEGAKLYINDQEVSVGFSKEFYKSVTLNDGDNVFVFRAVNKYGKSQSVVRTIKYAQIKAPELIVDEVPSTTNEAAITISGVVNDELDPAVTVYINDKLAASGNGSWSYEISLNEGVNNIIIVAANKFGKSTTIVKQVTKTQ